MKKLLLIILIIPILFTACTSSDSKIYLSDKYYNKGVFIDITNNDLNKIKNDNYLLYIYNPFCNFKIPCEKIFKDTMDKYKIDILSMGIEEYKKTSFFDKVRYAPSIIVIKSGKIIAYLDADKDEDYDKYQNSDEFEKWLSEYIYLEKK